MTVADSAVPPRGARRAADSRQRRSRLPALLAPALSRSDEVVGASLADAELQPEAGKRQPSGLLNPQHQGRAHLAGGDRGLAESLGEPAGVPVRGPAARAAQHFYPARGSKK